MVAASAVERLLGGHCRHRPGPWVDLKVPGGHAVKKKNALKGRKKQKNKMTQASLSNISPRMLSKKQHKAISKLGAVSQLLCGSGVVVESGHCWHMSALIWTCFSMLNVKSMTEEVKLSDQLFSLGKQWFLWVLSYFHLQLLYFTKHTINMYSDHIIHLFNQIDNPQKWLVSLFRLISRQSVVALALCSSKTFNSRRLEETYSKETHHSVTASTL